MNVTFDEGKQFYDLYATLLSFVNRKLKVSSEQFSDSREYTSTPPEARVAIRDALFSHRELIDEFAAENPAKLSSDELEIVGTWKHAVVGKFYVFRYLKKYTVFLTSDGSPNKAYGVLGLADPMKEVIGPYLPRLITTVLLPFQGKIIYDGLVSGYNITFGGGIKRMLNGEYKQAKETFGIITSLGDQAAPVPEKPKQSKKRPPKTRAVVGGRSASAEAKAIAEELVKMTDACCRETEEPTFPLRLTQAQRRAVAGLSPHLKPRLLLDQTNQRTLQFTLGEMRGIAQACRAAVPKAPTGMERNSLRHVVDAAERALEKFGKGKIHRIPASGRLYQFKITLKDTDPPIWRRIQVKNCSLDKLHEHIQTAMGWTNSHLHQFKINGVLYGDPELLLEGFEDDPEVVDSLATRLSEIVPEDGKRFAFTYEYDFGDGWEHEVLFERCLCAEKGARYPLCVEGERACPPEDVGGTYGYQEYLEAMADPKHERHEEFMEWRGPFDPEAFDAQAATKMMRRGLPNWRNQEWI